MPTVKTTKDKILELFKKEISMSVKELTDFLNMTDMAVRKHIHRLEKDGLIRSEHHKQSIGRPIQRYCLTSKGNRLFPNNYESISVEFLKDIQAIHGDESINQLFKKREERLTNDYKKRVTRATNKEKVEEMVKIQNEKGYMAELRQINENQYEMTEYNCPIFAVANEYHIACQCETNMFKQVLATDQVERVQCRAEGDNHCKFSVHFSDEVALKV